MKRMFPRIGASRQGGRRRRLAQISCAATLIGVVSLGAGASAQITSVVGRTGAVAAQASADATGNLCFNNIYSGPSAPPVYNPLCLESGAVSFGSPNGAVVINYNPSGHPSWKNDTILGVNGPDGTFTTVDVVAYENGHGAYPGLHLETYGCNKAGICALGAGMTLGAVGFDAFNGSGDTTNAAVSSRTTEAQTPAHNGSDLEFNYTPNGATAFTLGMALSKGGLGGFTVGSGATDLGGGTVHASDSIATDTHFRSKGLTPAVSSCGSGPTITGTDAAGSVGTGSGTSVCTISFSRAYSSAPVCIVQTFANATPAAYLTSRTTSQITVSWNSTFFGGFFYMCQDVS